MAWAPCLEVLCFRLGGSLWGIEAAQVERIAGPAEAIEGPVLDPAHALGVALPHLPAGPRLVLRLEATRAVLPVDEVVDLVSLFPHDLSALPPLVAGALPDERIWAMAKVGAEVVLLVDAEAVERACAPLPDPAG